MARNKLMSAVLAVTAVAAFGSVAQAQGTFGGMPTVTPQARKALAERRKDEAEKHRKKEDKRPAYVVVDQGGPNGSLDDNADPSRARFRTINEALEEVAWGGVVVVMPGTYHENIAIKRSVSLQGGTGGGVQIEPVSSDEPCLSFSPKNFNEHARISNISFLPPRRAGAQTQPCIDVQDGVFTMINSVVDGHGSYGAELVKISGGTAILEKNRFSGGRVGVYVEQSHSLWDSAMLIDNIVDENSDAGVHLGGKASMLATGNLINTNGVGLTYSGSGNATVVGNKILNNSSHGMVLGAEGQYQAQGKEVLVRLNQIWSNGQNGILVKNSSGLIEDNDIDGNGHFEVSTIGHLNNVPTIINDVSQNQASPAYDRKNKHKSDQTLWRVGNGLEGRSNR